VDFGEAIRLMRNGEAMCRTGWNGKGMCIRMTMERDICYSTKPYIYITTPDFERVPWTASQDDMLSFDWEIREL